MTSIEWLKKELEDYGSNSHLSLDWNTFDELCEQAKEKHKKEIIDAVGVGSQFDRDYLYGYHDKAEQYYQKTFKQK